jgi:hypothetical protein
MDDERTDRASGGSVVVARWVLPLLVAAIPFGLAVYQFLQFRVVAEKSRVLFETTGRELPRTELGSPLTLAFVFAVIGFIVLAIAGRMNNKPGT